MATTYLVAARSNGWRYKQIAMSDATDYSATAYDDSAWSVDDAMFGSSWTLSGVTYPYESPWDVQTRLWLRRSVVTPAVMVTLEVQIDNDVTGYWDGVSVGSIANPTGNPAWQTIGTFAATAGTHVLAIRATDDVGGGPGTDGCFIDARLSAPVLAPPLRLRQRGDDLKAPRLPRFHTSAQRSVRLPSRTYS